MADEHVTADPAARPPLPASPAPLVAHGARPPSFWRALLVAGGATLFLTLVVVFYNSATGYGYVWFTCAGLAVVAGFNVAHYGGQGAAYGLLGAGLAAAAAWLVHLGALVGHLTCQAGVMPCRLWEVGTMAGLWFRLAPWPWYAGLAAVAAVGFAAAVYRPRLRLDRPAVKPRFNSPRMITGMALLLAPMIWTICTFRSIRSGVEGVAPGPDERLAVTAAEDLDAAGAVTVSRGDGAAVRTLPGGRGAVAWDPDGRLLAVGQYRTTGSRATSACLWDPGGGAGPAAFLPEARCLAFSPDGRWLALGRSREFLVYDRSTGQPLPPFPTTAAVTCVAFSDDGEALCVGLESGEVALWDASARAVTHTAWLHAGAVTDVACVGSAALRFPPRVQVIAAGGSDPTLKGWVPAPANSGGAAGWRYRADLDWVSGLAVSRDATLAVAGGKLGGPGTVLILKNWKKVEHRLTAEAESVQWVGFSADGKTLYGRTAPAPDRRPGRRDPTDADFRRAHPAPRPTARQSRSRGLPRRRVCPARPRRVERVSHRT